MKKKEEPKLIPAKEPLSTPYPGYSMMHDLRAEKIRKNIDPDVVIFYVSNRSG